MGAQLAIAADLELQGEDTLSGQPSDEAIRQRSHQIWEREGRPEGRSEEHWARARAELAELLARTSNAHLAPPPAITEPLFVEAETPVTTPPVSTPPVATPPAATPPAIPPLNILPDFAMDALRDEIEQALANLDASVSHDDAVLAPDDVAPDNAVLAPDEVVLAPDDVVSADPLPLRLAPVRRANPTSTVPSIISAGLEFTGSLESPGDIQFDGTLEGTLCGAAVIVDENAVIQGDVIADEVTVRGRVRGRICGQRIVLRAGCHVEGEIFYGSFAVETGAQFDCRFEPLCAEEADADASSLPTV